jgi:hypothetical protein
MPHAVRHPTSFILGRRRKSAIARAIDNQLPSGNPFSLVNFILAMPSHSFSLAPLFHVRAWLRLGWPGSRITDPAFHDSATLSSDSVPGQGEAAAQIHGGASAGCIWTGDEMRLLQEEFVRRMTLPEIQDNLLGKSAPIWPQAWDHFDERKLAESV